MCLWAVQKELHYALFYFKLTSDAKIQPAITGREWLLLTWLRDGHGLCPILILWLVRTLIAQNLKSELMRKIYAASGNLFTEAVYLFTEADRISWRHLLMFLTVFFQWMYKTKYSCYQDSSVIHDWFVYAVFGPEMRPLSNSSEIQLRMLSFSLFTLLDAKEGLKGCPCKNR